MTTYIAEIEGKWYAFAADKNFLQVYSIGSDCPEGGRWFSAWTKAGVQCVSIPSPSRRAAYQKARRHGRYDGELYF